jgi:hypothetical protein
MATQVRRKNPTPPVWLLDWRLAGLGSYKGFPPNCHFSSLAKLACAGVT